jgi:hypothetical protein
MSAPVMVRPPASLSLNKRQVAVDLGRGALDHGHRPDEGGVGAQAGDGEVVNGALRLRAPIGPSRHAHFAQRVLLDAIIGRHVFLRKAKNRINQPKSQVSRAG